MPIPERSWTVFLAIVALVLGASVMVVLVTAYQDMHEAQDNVVQYKSELTKSQTSVDALQTQLGLTRDTLTQTNASLESAQAQLKTSSASTARLSGQVATCKHLAPTTLRLLRAVDVQAHAVDSAISRKPRLAKKQLSQASRLMLAADAASKGAGFTGLGDLIQTCQKGAS